jgi:hypothetical protein
LAVVAQRDATLSHQENGIRQMSRGAESLDVPSVARRTFEELETFLYLSGADEFLAAVAPPAPPAHVLAFVAQRDATLPHQEKNTRQMSRGAESLNVASVART